MGQDYYKVEYETESGDESFQPVAADNPGHAREQFEDTYPERDIIDISHSHTV